MNDAPILRPPRRFDKRTGTQNAIDLVRPIAMIAAAIALHLTAAGQSKEVAPRPDSEKAGPGAFRFEPHFIQPTLQFLLDPAAVVPGDPMLLRQSLFQPGGPGRDLDQNISTLRWMWTDEVSRGKEYQTLWNIVGAVEAGAVGYLAYRHISKYGIK